MPALHNLTMCCFFIKYLGFFIRKCSPKTFRITEYTTFFAITQPFEESWICLGEKRNGTRKKQIFSGMSGARSEIAHVNCL